MSRKIWICADGTDIRICDMADSHLQNAIRMLDREYAQGCITGCGYDVDGYEVSFDPHEHPLYDEMVAEAIHRRILNPLEAKR